MPNQTGIDPHLRSEPMPLDQFLVREVLFDDTGCETAGHDRAHLCVAWRS